MTTADRRRSEDRERGAALVLTLVFISVIFTIVAALMVQAQTSTRTLQVYRVDRAVHYGADGTLQAAILMIKNNADLGVAGGSSVCAMDSPLLLTSGPKAVFASGSKLTATCSASPGTSGSGVVTSGSQAPRDVTITVTCPTFASPLDPTTGLYRCNNLSATPVTRTIATARVRFDIDPGRADKTTWTVVPKIVSWKIYR